MTLTGRIALILTGVAVAGLATFFAVARWEDANRVATTASALGAVAAIGVAVWAAVRTGGPRPANTVTQTGKATARSRGRANTGHRGPSDADTNVRRTGDAEATDDGEANTGVQCD
jgi:hypothetical protein